MKTILALLIALYVPTAAAVFRCTDDHGLTLFGDTPPAACGNVPIYEVSPSGAVIRKIDPTPTSEQVKERAEEQARKKKAALAAAEQKRRDMALLNSYGSPQEFDVARDRNIEPVAGRIASTQDRIQELDKREQEINERIDSIKQEAAKKKGGEEEAEPPAWLMSNLDRVHKERAMLVTAVGRYKKEIEELRAKYDGDKRRWIVLKANAGVLDSEAVADPTRPSGSKSY
jgi:hypothetical protein